MSNVNGEHARQSDGRAWLLLSDGVPLSEGKTSLRAHLTYTITGLTFPTWMVHHSIEIAK